MHLKAERFLRLEPFFMSKCVILGQVTRFIISPLRKDSGYSSASEPDGCASPQNIWELRPPSGNSEDLTRHAMDILDYGEAREVFCKPSSASTRLSDSVQESAYCVSNNTLLSAGATNIFEESLDFNSYKSWSVKGPFHYESTECGFLQSISAEATNFPGLFADPLYIDDSDVSDVSVKFPVIPSSKETDFSAYLAESAEHKNPSITGNTEPVPVMILEESAVATNLDVKPTICCILTANNIEVELSKFLQNAHATEKFKLGFEKVSKTVSLIDLTHQDLRDLVDKHGSVSLTKMSIDTMRSKKFASIEKKNKRSLASCQSVPRGLALSEKFDEIQGMDLNSKTKNNRFTNFQRKDRNTGAKLEKEYMEKNRLSKFPSYSDIERRCKITLAIFDTEGYLKYLSPKFFKKIIFFYEGENDIFFVKNLKGFCRVE